MFAFSVLSDLFVSFYILCDGLDVSYAELSPQVRHEEKEGYILLIETLEAMEQC